MIYEEVEEKLEKLFASRLKTVSEASKTVWTNEIIAKRFTDDVIDDTIRDMIENDSEQLTLSNFFKLAKSKMPRSERKIDCPYCSGTGIVPAIKFSKNGKLHMSADYGLACVCGNATMRDSIRMNEDVDSRHHKTIVEDGYYLVFPSATEKIEYLNKVYRNNFTDIRR